MLTTSRLKVLEEVHRRHLEGLPNNVEENMVTDLFEMLKTMALRNEILRSECDALRQTLDLNRRN